MNEIRPIQWSDGKLWLLDQTRLPLEEVTLELDKCEQAIDAIHDMQVRGAPAIGVTAAYAMAMAAREISATSPDEYMTQLEDAASRVAAARPTAVNLFWAVERMVRL
ncbi:MAG: S-methyl-5-thioribose-1-phosphate isomerase, partial [Chloroflexota bacterium]|nr:S-methyl-5-thioribose-1-phosphate isomerase [Chloroflexota bacterium]